MVLNPKDGRIRTPDLLVRSQKKHFSQLFMLFKECLFFNVFRTFSFYTVSYFIMMFYNFVNQMLTKYIIS